MSDLLQNNKVRVYIVGEKPGKCTRCDGYLSRHSIPVRYNPEDQPVYYECNKCYRKYTTPNQYCMSSDSFICINKDEAELLIDDYQKQIEYIQTLKSKVVTCLKTEGVSIPGIVNKITAMSSLCAVSVFELVLLKKPDGSYLLVLLSSDSRINQKDKSFRVWGYLLNEGRRLLLEAKSRGEFFYYDGYNYEVVRVDVVNRGKYDQVLNTLKERSSFGSDKSMSSDSKNLPDEEKIVYVYQRLNNVCNKHIVETVTAQTYNVKDGRPIEINVFHCLDCDKYYVNYEALHGYIDKGVYPALNYYLVDNGLGNLNYASKLMMYGYNVRQGDLTIGERRRVLSWLIDSGIMSKHEIINDLKFKVDYNGKKKGNEKARLRWQDDIQYVSQYVKDNTKTIKPKFVNHNRSVSEGNNNTYDKSVISKSLLRDSTKLPKVNNEEKAKRLFPVGSTVRHERYGDGVVVTFEGKFIVIDFEGIGTKKLLSGPCVEMGMLKVKD